MDEGKRKRLSALERDKYLDEFLLLEVQSSSSSSNDGELSRESHLSSSMFDTRRRRDSIDQRV